LSNSKPSPFYKSLVKFKAISLVKMVKTVIALATVAALAVAASAAALPAAASPTTFSFAQWVEDIISHPDTALTVDEAVAAAHAASIVGSAGGLQKRAPYCYDQPGAPPRAPGRDAAACVDYLARIGAMGYICGIQPGQAVQQMCVIGGAQIWGSQSNQNSNSVNW
jgi:hypothetical protein